MKIILGPETGILEIAQLGSADADWHLDAAAPLRVEGAYKLLEHLIETRADGVYGIDTHFGHNVSQSIDASDWVQHQQALLDYLRVGVGRPLSPFVVRRALRLQTYKVGLGKSGVHPDTWRDLLALSSSTELPSVPCYGSLGASGDLIPMAHAVAPIFAAHPPRGPRDVIALVNTNAMMASLATEAWTKVWGLYREFHGVWLKNAAALGWKQFGAQGDGWESRSSKRPFRTAWIKATHGLQDMIDDALPAEAAMKTPVLPAQERYSIRCAPQILQDIGENLLFAAAKITEECLGIADNPVVLPAGFWHGGHFYATGLATAADLMADAAGRIADLIDRQILLLVTPESSHGLAANLAVAPGDHVKGLHQLASALVQQVRGLAMPARSLSFSCESNNQDVVPAAMAATLKLQDALSLSHELLRIGMFVAERGLRLRRSDGPLPSMLTLGSWPKFSIEDGLHRLTVDSKEFDRAFNSLMSA